MKDSDVLKMFSVWFTHCDWPSCRIVISEKKSPLDDEMKWEISVILKNKKVKTWYAPSINSGFLKDLMYDV